MIKSSYIMCHGRQIEVVQLMTPSRPPRKPLARIKFVQIPAHWIEKLAGQSGRTYDVALLLLQLDFKNRGQPVKLSNEKIRHLKLDHTVKSRALNRLERLGLVSVLHKRGAAPLVTVQGATST